MVENTFKLKAKDGKELFTYEWFPENKEPKKILQIIHGMAEHSARYRPIAEFFTYHGFVVFAMDLRGHGKTAKDINQMAFFAPQNGWKIVLNDIQLLTDKIKEKYPTLPLYLLGHSMGSFFARAYISTPYAQKINAVILSGTSGQRGMLLKIGKIIAKTQAAIKGKKAPSNLLHKMSFETYNAKFKPTKTPYDWLSSDPQVPQEYDKDPYCGWIATNRFYYDLFDLMDYIVKPTNIEQIPKNLPIYLFSGSKDPVGDFGKGPQKVAKDYKKNGIKQVEIKLYPEGRHEMLNEVNKNQVLNDLLNWINKH